MFTDLQTITSIQSEDCICPEFNLDFSTQFLDSHFQSIDHYDTATMPITALQILQESASELESSSESAIELERSIDVNDTNSSDEDESVPTNQEKLLVVEKRYKSDVAQWTVLPVEKDGNVKKQWSYYTLESDTYSTFRQKIFLELERYLSSKETDSSKINFSPYMLGFEIAAIQSCSFSIRDTLKGKMVLTRLRRNLSVSELATIYGELYNDVKRLVILPSYKQIVNIILRLSEQLEDTVTLVRQSDFLTPFITSNNSARLTKDLDVSERFVINLPKSLLPGIFLTPEGIQKMLYTKFDRLKIFTRQPYVKTYRSFIEQHILTEC